MFVTDILKNKAARCFAGVMIGTVASAGTFVLATIVKKKVDDRFVTGDEWTETDFPDIPEGVNEEDVNKEKAIEYTDKIVSCKYTKPDIVDYTKYSALVESVMADMSESEETAKEELPENPACSLISEAEYLAMDGHFAKADATYFTKDQILAGWNEDLIVRDIPTTVGWKAIKMFEDPSVKSVYVRNTDLNVDYEIVRCDDLFDDVVQETEMPEK